MKTEDKLMFMRFAEAAAERSHAIRRKVGCVLVKDGEVLSIGLNGMPPKWNTENCEDKKYFTGGGWLDPDENDYPYEDFNGRYNWVTKPECRHAEVAALEKMWKSHNTTEGAEAFVTTAPCKNCSIKLFTAGIKRVYYKEEYRSTEGLEYLVNNGVEIEKI